MEALPLETIDLAQLHRSTQLNRARALVRRRRTYRDRLAREAREALEVEGQIAIPFFECSEPESPGTGLRTRQSNRSSLSEHERRRQ